MDKNKPSTANREKAARIICCFAKENNSCSECQYNTSKTPFPDCFSDIREETDQILSLWPKVLSDEEIKEKVEAVCRYWFAWKDNNSQSLYGGSSFSQDMVNMIKAISQATVDEVGKPKKLDDIMGIDPNKDIFKSPY